MDPLSKSLEYLKLESVVYFHENLAAPWGLSIPAVPHAQFHMITAGRAVFKRENEFYDLATGDILILLKPIPHAILDRKNSPSMDGTTFIHQLKKGVSAFQGDQEDSKLLCGHFEFDRQLTHPLIQELPDLLFIKANKEEDPHSLNLLIELIELENNTEEAANRLIMERLAEILFLYALRRFIKEDDRKQGLFVSLRHPQLRKALSLIHERPEEKLNLERLAYEAGMSRTNFAVNFRKFMGLTPHEYLTKWRMLKARKLLLDSEQSIAQIAESVGYQSEASFSKVFKQKQSISPSRFRLTNSSS